MPLPENTLSADQSKLVVDGICYEAGNVVDLEDSCAYCAFQSHTKDCCPRVSDFGIEPTVADVTLLCREENHHSKSEVVWRLVGLDPRIAALITQK